MTPVTPVRLPVLLAAALALLVAVASWPVAALGLGQVRVLSGSGEPLLAEIPVVTSDPRELEHLQARLASPETFRRIGLEPPSGAAADLRFTVALDAAGNPVVRVTSPAPIDQPLLTFLLEVDWGQGRLVREYSVLVDAPQSAVAVGQPPIEAPLPAPATTVVRPPEAPVVQSEPLPPEPVPDDPAPAPVADVPAESVPEPQPVEPAPPAPVPVAPPPVASEPAPAPTQSADYGPVRRGQTLSEIAASQDLRGFTLNQAMLAILRANPDAFIDGNINLLREGAVLRVPERDALTELGAAEANAVVQAQVRSWRERSAPPVVATAAVATRDSADAAAPTRDAAGNEDEGEAALAEARLQIVPPAGEGQASGSRSGTSAGGEGDMVRNELRQAKETLAARDAEVEELRTRLAEVEELQRKQAELLDLKDSELAAVQHRLAQARTDEGAGTSEATSQQAPPPEAAQASSLPWLLGGALLLAAAAFAWWWQRRRPASAPTVAPGTAGRRNYDTDAMAASLKGAGASAPATAPATASSKKVEPSPTWHAGPMPVVGSAPAGSGQPPAAPGQEVPTGRDGLELARAYLDLGDHQAARTLLREVLLGPDPDVREEAARLLRGLG